MINNFNNFIKINEEYSFSVGDKVEILLKTTEYIDEYDWPPEMRNTIGKIGTITELEYEHDKEAYYVEFEDSLEDWYYFEDCIRKVEDVPRKIKWYKKGRFEKGKLNESNPLKVLYELRGKTKFKVGDRVIVNDNLRNNSDKYGLSKNRIERYIGKIYTIRAFMYDLWVHQYMYFVKDDPLCIGEDCIDLIGNEEEIKEPRVRWYKKGKLENDK